MRTAYRVVLVGILAATISCGKFILSAIPNVEVVTLLTALYGYVFGIYGFLASVVFVCVEPLLYGVGTWVVSYIIYWPTVATVFAVLGKRKVKNRFLLTFFATLLTAFFGVLTSLVDVGLFLGYFEDFFHRFAIMYARGIWFYITQIVCNIVLFSLVFKFLANKLEYFARSLNIVKN